MSNETPKPDGWVLRHDDGTLLQDSNTHAPIVYGVEPACPGGLTPEPVRVVPWESEATVNLPSGPSEEWWKKRCAWYAAALDEAIARAERAEAALVALWRDPENQLGIHVWMDAGVLLDEGELAPWFAKLLEGSE